MRKFCECGEIYNSGSGYTKCYKCRPENHKDKMYFKTRKPCECGRLFNVGCGHTKCAVCRYEPKTNRKLGVITSKYVKTRKICECGRLMNPLYGPGSKGPKQVDDELTQKCHKCTPPYTGEALIRRRDYMRDYMRDYRRNLNPESGHKMNESERKRVREQQRDYRQKRG